jgi:Protein of unknown function (DUF402)
VKPVPEQLLFRFVWPWRVFSAKPVTVVERREDRVVLWLAPETATKAPPGFHVSIPELVAGTWTLSNWRWYGGRLMIWQEGDSHSTYVSWSDKGEFLGWYVNLEDPWRETTLGFDSTDHLLDIVIDPDRSWRWKDEDHLAEAVEIGLFSPEQARAFRTEGERAIERIEAWAPPFDEGWEKWRPDPTWPLPSLPNGWERL